MKTMQGRGIRHEKNVDQHRWRGGEVNQQDSLSECLAPTCRPTPRESDRSQRTAYLPVIHSQRNRGKVGAFTNREDGMVPGHLGIGLAAKRVAPARRWSGWAWNERTPPAVWWYTLLRACSWRSACSSRGSSSI